MNKKISTILIIIIHITKYYFRQQVRESEIVTEKERESDWKKYSFTQIIQHTYVCKNFENIIETEGASDIKEPERERVTRKENFKISSVLDLQRNYC